MVLQWRDVAYPTFQRMLSTMMMLHTSNDPYAWLCKCETCSWPAWCQLDASLSQARLPKESGEVPTGK